MKIKISGVGKFEALIGAMKFCDDNGISYGTPCRGSGVIGLMFGNHAIGKWRNLSRSEKRAIHGTMKGHMRKGPVVVYIKPDHEWRLKDEAT